MRNYLLLFLTVLFSCSSFSKVDENKMVGIYTLDVDFYGVDSRISLNKNKTFKYEWGTGLISGITNGKWKYEDGFIVLHSELQPDDKEFKNQYKILKNELNNLDSINIKV